MHVTMLVFEDEEWNDDAELICSDAIGYAFDYMQTYKDIVKENGGWNDKGIILKDGCDTEDFYKFRHDGKEYCWRCFKEDADYEEMLKQDCFYGVVFPGGNYAFVDEYADRSIEDKEERGRKVNEAFLTYLKNVAPRYQCVEIVDAHI